MHCIVQALQPVQCSRSIQSVSWYFSAPGTIWTGSISAAPVSLYCGYFGLVTVASG
ncbi:MAG: hypothetical protein ACE5PM_04455 [Candidatus Hydrothermarchaeales archaeon]